MSETPKNNGGSPTKRQRRDNRGVRGHGGRGRGAGRGDTKTDRRGNGEGRNIRRRRNNSRRNSAASSDNKNGGETDDVPSVNNSDTKVQNVGVKDDVSSTTQEATKSRHQFSTTLFTECKISAPSQRALSEVLNYSYMTKVQEATLPSILNHDDVVAKAKTGSGKTTAFLLPILEKLMTSPPTQYISAVVLSPTRELTQQIASEFQKLSTFHSAQDKVYICMIGGTNIDKDKRALKQMSKLRLLLATPGRLQDHLNQNTANIVERLSRVQILCLDEAGE